MGAVRLARVGYGKLVDAFYGYRTWALAGPVRRHVLTHGLLPLIEALDRRGARARARRLAELAELQAQLDRSRAS